MPEPLGVLVGTAPPPSWSTANGAPGPAGSAWWTPGDPHPPDPEEPAQGGRGRASGMGLDFVVVTTVARDDLPDEGAGTGGGHDRRRSAVAARAPRSRC